MKSFPCIILLSLLFSLAAHAQYRGEEPGLPSVREGVYRDSGTNNILGFFNPDNLEMRHSLSVGYGSVGDRGLGMTMYTNSLRYRISGPLSVRADISMMFAPFGSMASQMQQDLSGIFLRRASVDYRPSTDLHISLRYMNDPYALYGPYSPYGDGRYRTGFGGGLFYDTFDDDDRW